MQRQKAENVALFVLNRAITSLDGDHSPIFRPIDDFSGYRLAGQ
jgi:hypothetical protein